MARNKSVQKITEQQIEITSPQLCVRLLPKQALYAPDAITGVVLLSLIPAFFSFLYWRRQVHCPEAESF